jgi:LmbE family N-acetylglucosaminyl deacetylase
MLPLHFARRASGGPLKVLCIGAHSDDIEIGCGATLLQLMADRAAPVEITWVVLSGSHAREKEARASARDFTRRAASARIETAAFRDGYFPSLLSDIKDFFESLKATEDPDVIFTHRRNDLHQDHRVSNELTRNTWRNHLILEYEIPKFDGDLTPPNVFMPVSQVHATRKAALLMKHFATQRNKHWFDEETFLGLMRLRGLECASPTRYAEGFHCYKLTLG